MIVEWEFRWRGDKRPPLPPIGFCLRGVRQDHAPEGRRSAYKYTLLMARR